MDKRQTLLAKATEIALRHKDLHPFSVAVVAANATDPLSDDFEAFIVGLLHDSIEDDYATWPELEIFNKDINRAVDCLTRDRENENYWDYIEGIKSSGSPLAIRVKKADATVNLNRCRNEFGFGSLYNRYERVLLELP